MTTFSPDSRAVLKTSMGDLTLEFLGGKAPRTCEHFVRLARRGFYDGLTFHRIIKGFMVQGGCPKGDGTGGPGQTLRAEFNDTPHVKGVVSMARGNDPHSAGSQFFIVHGDARYLDSRYTAFARVVDGLDVLDKISAVPVEENRFHERSVPREPVFINSVVLEGIEFDANDRDNGAQDSARGQPGDNPPGGQQPGGGQQGGAQGGGQQGGQHQGGGQQRGQPQGGSHPGGQQQGAGRQQGGAQGHKQGQHRGQHQGQSPATQRPQGSPGQAVPTDEPDAHGQLASGRAEHGDDGDDAPGADDIEGGANDAERGASDRDDGADDTQDGGDDVDSGTAPAVGDATTAAGGAGAAGGGSKRRKSRGNRRGGRRPKSNG